MIFPKKFLPLIIAVAAGLIATYLVNVYIQQRTAETREMVISNQKNMATVVVAKQDIPLGTTLTDKMFEEITVYSQILQPRTASSIDRVVNKINIAPISKGEQVLLNKLSIAGQETSLSSKVPRGKRAITVPVDNLAAVGGMVKPGDHVDVMGTVPVPTMTPEGKQATTTSTMLLFQDTLVLAVGQDFASVSGSADDKRKERTSSPVITLALSPQEANLIAFVQEQGKIRLILRSPEDTQTQPAVPASWEALWMATMPQLFQQKGQDAQQAITEPVKQRSTVEIFRGSNKEVKNTN